MKPNKSLRKLQMLELKIALEVKRICEKNHIPYFLTAGTLLGAVRHGGFIPWDDDMDIGMLREDYNRFVKACQTDLGKEFFLQTWDTDPGYPFSYAKIRLNGTHIKETFAGNNKSLHNGIFIDIFPFDNVPEDTRRQKGQARKYYFCKRLLWIKKGMGSNMKNGPVIQKLKYWAFYVLSLLIPYKVVKEYFQKGQVQYNDEASTHVVADGAYGYEKETLNRTWVTNLEPIKFENEEFMSYKDKAQYLEYFYGDYMKLPPENKRGGHGLLDVNFGSYE